MKFTAEDNLTFCRQQKQGRRAGPRGAGGGVRHPQGPEVLAHQELVVQPLGQRRIRAYVHKGR